MNTLLIGEIHPDAHKLLQEHTSVLQVSNEEFLAKESFSDIEAVVLRTFTPFGKEQTEKFPKLKYVIICSVGTDNLDLNELKKREIELIHIPGTNANSVAEHTMYFLYSLLRKDPRQPSVELKGKTVGIIGLGHIGKLVAEKLLGCGAKVIAYDIIKQDPVLVKKLYVEMKEFDHVLQESDIISVHVPLNKNTKNLINEECFAKMKQDSFFINTSREEVINEDALLKYQDKFRGIALDVHSEKLNNLKGNIILTDHVGAQGEESFRNQCMKPVEKFVENI